MQTKNAHNIKVIRVARAEKSMADFYKNNYDVALNPNTEILPLMGSKEGMHISLAFLNEERSGADSKPRLPNLYFCD
jgi:aspartate/methionine/tyrosine aminotransferase